MFFWKSGNIFHKIEQSTSIAVGKRGKKFIHIIGEGDSHLVGATAGKSGKISPAQRLEPENMQARKELTSHTEGGVLRRCGYHGHLAAFKDGKEEILLSLGKTVQLIQNQNLDAGELTAELLYASFRSTEAQNFLTSRMRKKQGKGRLSAPGRPEKQKAGHISTPGKQSFYLSTQMGLAYKIFKLGRTQTFRKRGLHALTPS